MALASTQDGADEYSKIVKFYKVVYFSFLSWNACVLNTKYVLSYYVGHLESKERLRIQPAQLFNFS